MKASELRIGNCVKSSIPKEDYDIVRSINPEYCVTKYSTKTIEEVEPIAITKEWLDRLGFVYNDSEEIHEKKIESYLTLIIDVDDNIAFIGEIPHWSQIPKYPEYVHQIQNLYHTLTGQELIVKEEALRAS